MFQNSINEYVNDDLREKLSTLCSGGSGFSYNIKPYIDLANGFTLVLKIIVQKDSSKESCIYLNVKNLENIKDARWCTNIKSKCFLWPLADNLIPIINNESDCDILADLITKVLDMDGSLPVDIDKIMNILNIPVPKKGNYEEIYFSRMNLDSNDVGYKKICYSEKCHNPRFIIMHQIVHWCLHRYAFQLAALNGKAPRDTICNIKEYAEYDKTVYTCFWNIEKNVRFDAVLAYQADSIARKILVPTRIICEILRTINFRQCIRELTVLEDFLYELSYIFDVSIFIIKSRMVDLGYIELVQGYFNIVDEKILKPYFCKRLLNESKETICIGEEDLKAICNNDSEFSRSLKLNKYLYVDGHIVFNNKKYIDSSLNLTAYARYNMDECCLVFKKNRNPYVKCKSAIICSSNDKKEIYEVKYEELDEKINRMNNQIHLSSLFTCNFSTTIRNLMKDRGLTIEQLAGKSDLSDSKIKVLRKNEKNIKDCDKKTIIKLCIGLELTASHILMFFSVAGHPLVLSNYEDYIIFSVLDNIRYDDKKDDKQDNEHCITEQALNAIEYLHGLIK